MRTRPVLISALAGLYVATGARTLMFLAGFVLSVGLTAPLRIHAFLGGLP